MVTFPQPLNHSTTQPLTKQNACQQRITEQRALINANIRRAQSPLATAQENERAAYQRESNARPQATRLSAQANTLERQLATESNPARRTSIRSQVQALRDQSNSILNQNARASDAAVRSRISAQATIDGYRQQLEQLNNMNSAGTQCILR